jgi:hypothetical protein
MQADALPVEYVPAPQIVYDCEPVPLTYEPAGATVQAVL